MAEAQTQDVLKAPYVLEYTYRRSTGPVLGAFLTALRDGKLLGAKCRDGKVIVPPAEYGPDGESTTGLVDVGPGGVVSTWAWVSTPRPVDPLRTPFAWALIRLDGADTGMLHAVDAGRADLIKTGMRVRPRWKAERTGSILDLECFVPESP